MLMEVGRFGRTSEVRKSLIRVGLDQEKGSLGRLRTDSVVIGLQDIMKIVAKPPKLNGNGS